jgi:hypothetical protein
LQSILQIDFQEDDSIDTGMFWMNESASLVVWGATTGAPYVLRDLERDIHPDILYSPRTIIGYAFDEDTDDSFFQLMQWDGRTYIDNTEIELSAIPLDFWMSVEKSLYLETMDENGQLALWEYDSQALDAAPIEHSIQFSDEDVVRIGRIPPPYSVTSSLEGIVKLWNLEAGETLYEVNNGTGQPSVFGAINTPPSHLVWRDNANESLYLLNFETSENSLIAELNGDYAQWFFLNPDASVILALDLGFQQNVVAWDVATGEKIDLGHYRECTRPQPDMARLSADGTTLVIGCDTGLDIWRIVH